tara:strand:+ start:3420 stop:5657 length:2238 start_codon:yes stop_codon:yes gene_type:complete
MNLRRIFTGILLAAFLVSLGLVATRISDSVDTDILSLLPGDSHDPVVAAAVQKASADASNRVAFAIEGGSADDRRRAATQLSELLIGTGFFHSSDQDAKAFWQWLFDNRTDLLCPSDRALLQAGGGKAVADAALAQWYAPMGVANGGLLRTDPLLLTNRLLACFLPNGLGVPSGHDVDFVFGSIDASVFRLDVQDGIGDAVAQWELVWRAKGLVLSRAGAVFHAAYGAEHARSEMTVIGGLTTLAVILFYWMMFRSFRAPLIAIGMVVFSLTIGLAVSLLIFDRVHAMALVFGAALIGMVVDYTTYFLVTGLASPDAPVDERQKQIFKPLTMGMLTSVGAFAALIFFPVPAFQQISVFGSVGLFIAWSATLLLLPILERGAMKRGPGALLVKRFAAGFLSDKLNSRFAVFSIVLCGIISGIGFYHLQTLDDVRQFQAPSAQLVSEEARIRELTGFAPSSSFLLVQGQSREEASQREEQLIGDLSSHGKEGSVLISASAFSPSLDRVGANRKLIEDEILGPHLEALLQSLGLSGTSPYGSVASDRADLPEFISSLRGETNGVWWSIVPVIGTVELRPDLSGVSYIEPASRYSDLLRVYRHLASYGLAAAVLATALILLAFYRRLSALCILVPTVIALLITPALTSLVGVPYSFFSAMALFLVAGAGVDYAIFQWESPEKSGDWTRVGIVLAAVMTCISVGLMGLSSVLPVRSFGLTVAIGILVSLLLSPLARSWAVEDVSGGKHDD